MTDLSKPKIEMMLDFLDQLKAGHPDEASLSMVEQIQGALAGKKYGLVWEEHEEEGEEKPENQVPVFVEDKSRAILAKPDSDACHLLFEGDNLYSLRLLKKTYTGKIGAIYIDPPYNTGKRDFIYDDSFVNHENQYSHSKWLSFMNKRLKLALKLLSEDGIIFISIDDNELAHLKLLCDEIWGEENYIGLVAVENNPKGRKNSAFLSVSSEFLLIYAKDISKSRFVENIPKELKDLTQDEEGNYMHKSGKRVLVGENNFNDNVTDIASRKHYSVYHHKGTGDFILVRETDLSCSRRDLLESGYDRYYSYNEKGFVLNTYTGERLTELYENGALEFKNGKIYEKNFSTTLRAKSIWTNRKYKAVVDNQPVEFQIDLKTTSAKQELRDIFQTKGDVFSNPKNVGLLKLIITLLDNKDITILDFFAGSGTTGQAVLEQNQLDGGKRKFILCTNNENKICEEVTYKRLKTVITGKRENGSRYSDGIAANLRYYRMED